MQPFWFLAPALVLIGAGCRPQQSQSATADRPASVNTAELPVATDSSADSLLVDVRTLDSTIRVDARYAGPDNFTGAPLPGYEAPRALLRREAAVALTRVQARLQTGGLGLLVFDGYRPVRATRAMVQWADRAGRRDLLKDGYIASRSRHNLGLAVDLTLVDPGSGTALDMGTPFDTFSEAAHTANAAGRVLRYRQILVRAMESEGFRNYEKEWWHFSYEVPGATPFDRVIK
jgi:zinc D-Ala-D-Ala dipeptidase